MTIPSQGYFSRCQFPFHSASVLRNWNPGHYVSFYSSLSALTAGAIGSGANTIYTAISTRSAVMGVDITVGWPSIETAYGVYDDSIIDAHLARCETDGKHLCVRLAHKTFSVGSHAVPAYMQAGVNDAVYGNDNGGGTGNSSGGEYETTVGYVVKLNVAAVYNRFVALLQHLGDRYGSNANFEMIYFNESAQGVPVNYTFTAAVTSGFYTSIRAIGAAARAATSKTIITNLFNFSDDLAVTYAAFKAAGVGIGNPDIFTSTIIGETRNTDPYNHNIALAGGAGAFSGGNAYDRAYTYSADAYGNIPMISLVSPDSWDHDRPHQSTPTTYIAPATAAELYAWCRDQMHTTHMFWYYNNTTPAAYNVGTVYDYRDLAISGGVVYQSKVAANVGNAVGNTTYWQNLGTNFPAITNQFYPLMDTLEGVAAGGLNAAYPDRL